MISLSVTIKIYLRLISSLLLIFKYFKQIVRFIRSFKAVKYLGKYIKTYPNERIDEKKVVDSIKFQYHPVTYASCTVPFERIKKQVLEAGYANRLFYKNLEKIMNHLPNLFEIADKRCCGQIRANGYFSICKIILRILELFEQELDEKNLAEKIEQKIDYLNKISVLVMTIIDTCVQIAEETNLDDEKNKTRSDNELLKNYPKFYGNFQIFKQIMVKKHLNNSIDQFISDDSINNNAINNNPINNNSINSSSVHTSDDQEFNSLPLLTPYLSTSFECVNEAIYQSKSPNKHVIFGKHFMTWLDSDLRSILKVYIFILPFLRVRLYRYFQLIFSSDYRARALNRILTFSTINFPFEPWNFSDSKIALLITDYQTRHTNTNSKELFLPTQNSIIINQSPYERLTINDKEEIRFKSDRKIRCKYIKCKNIKIENCNKLILHFHGGGFLSQSCDSHEIYLRSWVNYNRIPILTVDYKVKECFPNGLKDCFDVYLWLRMAPEEEIRTKLGFYPQKIVLLGDSAGGNLALGVVLALNDLRIDYLDKFNLKIQMPDGLVCIYAPFFINLNPCSSRILSALDALVPFGVQFVIFEAILGLIPGLKPNTRLQTLKSLLFPSSDPVPWFVCDQNELKKKVYSMSQIVISPFLNSLLYEKYNSLTDVPLQLISAEFCSFLDDSITMAKIWKGPIKIDVIPDMCHGFINFRFAGDTVSNAAVYCGQKIAEMF